MDAACLRLRAVLLTSLTTIGGLTPLMFETSLQAQFLIPMAVSISFGLAFATLLVLLALPAPALHIRVRGHVAGVGRRAGTREREVSTSSEEGSPGLNPPLKWAGGKRWLVPHLLPWWEGCAPRRLVEPLLRRTRGRARTAAGTRAAVRP